MSDTSFQVVLERTGKTFDIPADATILEVLELEGIAVPSSCQQGVCGTCETKVLAGEIDHRDMVLTAYEKSQGQSMMICCSRAKGATLTIDL
jgi:vanillate O-demethylase ferredoxin subunit